MSSTASRVFSGARLKAIRKEEGLTGGQLAVRIGVTQAAISGWENGHWLPNIDNLVRLTDALDCRIDDLFQGARDVA
ncbi:helix-turn-helix domain-containing protein [Streptomyces sp. NPDC102365]|uniref:helix-turn-helix domain-containing protein n=1 Tax=Streptomyces sp. NPDC102365 TaxID=3366162 RepID=UPI003803B988